MGRRVEPGMGGLYRWEVVEGNEGSTRVQLGQPGVRALGLTIQERN
jgi:hypothetical protein